MSDPRDLPGDRAPGEVSDEPVPDGAADAPEQPADAEPVPALQDRRRPK